MKQETLERLLVKERPQNKQERDLIRSLRSRFSGGLKVVERKPPRVQYDAGWEEQPRVPVGSPGGGQWTSGEGGVGSTSGSEEGIGEAGGDGNNVSAVNDGIKAIPGEHAAVLQGKVRVQNKKSVLNSSGKEVAGLAQYLGDSSDISIADTIKGKSLKDPTGTTVHELGHALDRVHGNRLSSQMAATIRADAARLNGGDRYLAAHYLSNEREMFAEVYKLTYSPSKRGAFAMGQKAAERKFARSVTAMRELRL